MHSAASAHLEAHTSYIRKLAAQGGPQPDDYGTFTAWLGDIHGLVDRNQLSDADVAHIRAAFGDALSPQTIQGLALTKPHGYAGDFEIIDRLYTEYVASEHRLAGWDRYLQAQAAPKAVRNRKTYFHRLLDAHATRRSPLHVLKIASGPGRSMFEWFAAHNDAPVFMDCVDLDENAIAYAAELNRPFLDRIRFTQANALTYRPTRTYDLVWAAGIFDYFDDTTFVSLCRRLAGAIGPGGELVIGNFSVRNPTRPYMELFDWRLNHRSAADLVTLADRANISPAQIHIAQEPEGVNLFLHIGTPQRTAGQPTGVAS